MAIIRSKIARQLLADGGVSLDDAKMMAPKGEFLAYINPKEAGILRSMGGSGRMTPMGIPSFTEDEEDQIAMDAPSYDTLDNEEQQAVDRGDPGAIMSTTTRDVQGFGPRTNIADLSAPSFFDDLSENFKNYETDSRMNRIGRGVLTTPGAIKSAFGFRDVPPELLQTLAEDYTQGGLFSEGLVGGDISLANAARTFQGLEDLGVDLTKDIRSQVADISRSKFAERFGPKTPKSEGGDNEPIKKLRGPITEKKEEPKKSEFDDILKFYGARFSTGGRTGFEGSPELGGQRTQTQETYGGPPGGDGGDNTIIDRGDVTTKPENEPKITAPEKRGIMSKLGDFFTIGEEEDDTKNISRPTGGYEIKSGMPGSAEKRDAAFQKTLDEYFPQGLANGGEIRQNYGLGSIVKKATRAVKKIAKSPLGKAALAFGAYKLAGSPKIFGEGSVIGKLTADKAFKGILGASLAAGLFAKEEEEDEKLPTVANTDPQIARTLEFYGGPRRFASEGGDIDKEPKNYEKDPEYKGWKKMYEINPDVGAMHPKHSEYLNFYNAQKKAEGGIMSQEDEMLNLGGNEMDLRGGGFVPLGEYEKKDDVPARLSKNEFVMTADAVRAAGGGSVDRGADIMYKTMKTLENKVA